MAQKDRGNMDFPGNQEKGSRKRRTNETVKKKTELNCIWKDEENRKESKRRRVSDSKRDKKSSREMGRRKERRAERAGVARGMVLFALQLVASLAFLWLLCWMDILIVEYLVGVAGVLLVLLGITLVSQLAVRGKGKIVGKVFGIMISVLLFVGSFYLYKTGGALLSIAGGVQKVIKWWRLSERMMRLQN